MISYLISIIVIYLLWRMKDYFNPNPLTNYSKTSTPLLKVAFAIAFLKPDEIFLFPRNCARTLKKSYLVFFFGMWSFEICRAKDVEKILGSSKHIDKSQIYELVHPFLKTGLLTSKGDKWHKRRRMLTPAFHFDILKEFLEIFKEESDRLVGFLTESSGKVVEINSISSQFTLNTICESAMGVKLSNLGDDGVIYRQKIYEIGKWLLFRLLKPWLMTEFTFSLFGYKKQFDAVLKPVHEFTKSIIKQRKATFLAELANKKESKEEASEGSENIYARSKKRRYAMLDTLLQAQCNGLIDDEGIIEETDTFTFEGHDTTSAALTFTLLLLAEHPEAQERIFEEIQDFLGDMQDPTIEDFNKMEYLDRVVKESLRIYPPVTFISRELSEDYQHDGYLQPKGTVVNIHIYDVHRDPEIFPDPEKFDPDRFLPENSAARHNFAFIAFSAGMRNCIGQRFAMLELKMVLSKLIKTFKIEAVTRRADIVPVADMVIRTRDPVKMRFVER